MGGKSRSSNTTNNTSTEQVLNNTGDGTALSLSDANIGGGISFEDNSDEISMAALDFAGNAMSENVSLSKILAAEQADISKSLFTDATDTVSYNMQMALGEVADTARYSQQMTGQTIERALALADRKTSSEGENISKDLIKYGSIIAAVMVGSSVVMGIVKR